MSVLFTLRSHSLSDWERMCTSWWVSERDCRFFASASCALFSFIFPQNHLQISTFLAILWSEFSKLCTLYRFQFIKPAQRNRYVGYFWQHDWKDFWWAQVFGLGRVSASAEFGECNQPCKILMLKWSYGKVKNNLQLSCRCLNERNQSQHILA